MIAYEFNPARSRAAWMPAKLGSVYGNSSTDTLVVMGLARAGMGGPGD
jgi:hypothetical protein